MQKQQCAQFYRIRLPEHPVDFCVLFPMLSCVFRLPRPPISPALYRLVVAGEWALGLVAISGAANGAEKHGIVGFL